MRGPASTDCRSVTEGKRRPSSTSYNWAGQKAMRSLRSSSLRSRDALHLSSSPNYTQWRSYTRACKGLGPGSFAAVRRAVNVLKLMFLRVSKYPSNAIFRNAIINAQRANVTGSMIWLTSPRPPSLCRAGLRSPDACILLVIASEASFLVCSMRGFSIYIYISGRTSCRKCSKPRTPSSTT